MVSGMTRVEYMDAGQVVYVLLQNETLIWDLGGGGGGGKGGELVGEGGGGSKRGCEAGLKWDFHLFIYLAELIAQGCLLAFCCMFCGLSAHSPLLPPSYLFLMCVSASANACVCVHKCISVLILCE